ncbi:sulfatase [Opitutales bacterium]|nr:sulfatase [Opitutales bacterium]
MPRLYHLVRWSTFLWGVFFSASFFQPNASADEQPNILFILVDDMGWRDLSCYGNEVFETPNLDKLARQGMRFTNAYAACPICGPSRAAIMTGKFPSTSGYVDNYVSETKGGILQRTQERSHLELEAVTIAESLKAGGYQTGFLGKWHLTNNDETHLPTDQGFDVNIAGGWKGHPRDGFFSPYRLAHLKDGPKGEYLTDRITTEAISVLEQFSKNDTPWFVYMSYYTVHAPFHSKPEKTKKYAAKKARNPKYGGMMESMDENIGRMLSWLDQKGLRENTIIFFTSDNGGYKPATHNTPLRGHKGDLYEGGIRVSCIAEGPGVSKGVVSDTPIHGTDYYATLLELAGIEKKPELAPDSMSLVPLLKGDTKFNRGPMFWHYPVAKPLTPLSKPGSVVRDGDWKYLYFYNDKRSELYNLKDDIGEKNNLIASMPEKAKQLKTQLDSVLKAHNAIIPGAVPARSESKVRNKKHQK